MRPLAPEGRAAAHHSAWRAADSRPRVAASRPRCIRVPGGRLHGRSRAPERLRKVVPERDPRSRRPPRLGAL